MAIAETGRQGSANRMPKAITERRSRTATAGTPAAPALFAVKYDPNWQEGLTDGQQVSSADVAASAPTVNFKVDTVNDPELTDITWASESIPAAVQRVNKSKRWVAQFADGVPSDTAPGATAGQTVSTSGLVGRDPRDWVYVTAAVETSMSIGFGVREFYSNRRGPAGASNLTLPDFRNTGYSYPLTPATNPAQVGRGGGISASQGEGVLKQRASKFRDFAFDAEAQKSPTNLNFECQINRIWGDLEVAGPATSRLVTVVDLVASRVYSFPIAGITGLFDLDVTIASSGPLWVTFAAGDGSSAINGGDTLAAQGDVRIS